MLVQCLVSVSQHWFSVLFLLGIDISVSSLHTKPMSVLRWADVLDGEPILYQHWDGIFFAGSLDQSIMYIHTTNPRLSFCCYLNCSRIHYIGRWVHSTDLVVTYLSYHGYRTVQGL